MEFRLLGPFEAISDGRPVRFGGAKPRAVAAVLLLNANRTVSSGQMVEALWIDPPRAAASNLRTYVARLRRAFAAAGEPESRMVTDALGYRLTVNPDELDLTTFETFVALGEQSLVDGDPASATDQLRRALDLWRGPTVTGVQGGPPLEMRISHLEQRRLEVYERWAEAALAAGHHMRVAGEMTTLVRSHPLREKFWRHLMLALYRCDRQSAALAAYQDAYRLLDRELGVAPGRPLQLLHQQILNVDPRLDPATARNPAIVSTPVPQQLPPDVATFVGRAEQLDMLDTLLLSRERAQGSATATITGTAGSGKTALAVHWAHRVTAAFPDGQVFVNLRGFATTDSPMTREEAVRAMLDALGVVPQRVPDTAAAQVGLYRSLVADRRMLVVLDNARDTAQVRSLIPGAARCVTLVTSRNQLSGLVAAGGANPVPVGQLTRAESRELLVRRLGATRVNAETAAAEELIDGCARLPIALALVAARGCLHPLFPLASLAAEVCDTRSVLDTLEGDDADTNVRAAFRCSYRTLSPVSARLFRLLGLHPGPDATLNDASSLAEVPAGTLRSALAELVRAHLLTEHIPGRYTFHDLLRVYATELTHDADPESDRRSAVRRLLDRLLHTAHAAALLLQPHRSAITPIPPESGVVPERIRDAEQAMAWFGAEHPVLLAAVQLAAREGFDRHAWQLAWSLDNFLDRRGQWHEHAAIQQIALECAERAADRVGQAHAHRGLGLAFGRQGLRGDAAEHLTAALELFEAADEPAGAGHVHLDLGWVAVGDDVRQALGHARAALERFTHAGHAVGRANALNGIGWCLTELGDHEQGRDSCQQAIALFTDAGDVHGEAPAWDSLGYAQHRLGEHAEAVASYERSLALYRRLGNGYFEADVLRNLAVAQVAAGDPDGARLALKQAHNILVGLGNQDAERVLATLTAMDA